MSSSLRSRRSCVRGRLIDDLRTIIDPPPIHPSRRRPFREITSNDADFHHEILTHSLFLFVFFTSLCVRTHPVAIVPRATHASIASIATSRRPSRSFATSMRAQMSSSIAPRECASIRRARRSSSLVRGRGAKVASRQSAMRQSVTSTTRDDDATTILVDRRAVMTRMFAQACAIASLARASEVRLESRVVTSTREACDGEWFGVGPRVVSREKIGFARETR